MNMNERRKKGEEIESWVHLSFRTSAVRHPGDGPFSVGVPSSLERSRVPADIALIYVDTIFIRTDR